MGRRPKLTTEEKAIKTSWDVYLQYLESDSPIKDRAELAAKIVSRSVTQRHDVSGGIDLQVMGRITIDGKEFVPNIGDPAHD